MWQMPPFLKSSARGDPRRCAASSPQIYRRLSHVLSRRERFKRLHRGLVRKAVRQQVRRLLRAYEWTGEDLVDLDIEPGQPFDDLLEPGGAGFGQRTPGVVGPFLTAFRGNRMANQIQVTRLHTR